MAYLFLPMLIVDRRFFFAFSQLDKSLKMFKIDVVGTDEAITYSTLRLDLSDRFPWRSV